VPSDEKGLIGVFLAAPFCIYSKAKQPEEGVPLAQHVA
jgi:hypothetical protein